MDSNIIAVIQQAEQLPQYQHKWIMI